MDEPVVTAKSRDDQVAPPTGVQNTAIPALVHTEVLRRLRAAETEHQISILLAVESGSRAWGFASPDSDFDVRFIYIRPKSWYLTIDLEHRRDVIEYPIVDDIDLNGWDIRKALRLFAKSNPAFVEWIQSPIEYARYGDFTSRARALLSTVYSPSRGIHHYVSMARRNYVAFLRTETVRLKKYFYVLRALMAARWIERHAAAPPIEFQRLLAMASEHREVLADVAQLLERKSVSSEIATGVPYPNLNEFIETELERLRSRPLDLNVENGTMDTLNELFAAQLDSAPPGCAAG